MRAKEPEKEKAEEKAERNELATLIAIPEVRIGDTVMIRFYRHTDRLAHNQHEAAEDEAVAAAEAAIAAYPALAEEARKAGKPTPPTPVPHTRRPNPAPKEPWDEPAMVYEVIDADTISAMALRGQKGWQWVERSVRGTGDREWSPR